MDMERLSGRAKEEDQGAVALVLDLSKAFERVSLPVVWAWATHFSFPRKILRVLCGYFEHQRRVQFVGCAAEPLRTITAILPGSKRSCLLLRNVSQDALSEVLKIYPPLKLIFFVDDIAALVKGKKKRSGGNGKEGDEEAKGGKGFHPRLLLASADVCGRNRSGSACGPTWIRWIVCVCVYAQRLWSGTCQESTGRMASSFSS